MEECNRRGIESRVHISFIRTPGMQSQPSSHHQGRRTCVHANMQKMSCQSNTMGWRCAWSRNTGSNAEQMETTYTSNVPTLNGFEWIGSIRICRRERSKHGIQACRAFQFDAGTNLWRASAALKNRAGANARTILYILQDPLRSTAASCPSQGLPLDPNQMAVRRQGSETQEYCSLPKPIPLLRDQFGMMK